ncbi:hypothetical protein [Nonomuraea salmonea]|uniref:hypothetical protein n=1 Tax=Nonomuraea salmonea TaxID=46181 RepID=UPI0031EB754E
MWDEEADPLVASLLDRGDVPEVNRLLWDWNRNDQPLPAGLPADLRDFMERARRLPSWADRAKLETAATFTKARGLYLNLLNGVGGGMLSTAIPKEARAVYYSKGGADMEDRVAKTSIFGFAVGDLDAYRPQGSCVVEAVKTRLVHAAVRHLLQQSPHWAATSRSARRTCWSPGTRCRRSPCASCWSGGCRSPTRSRRRTCTCGR